MLLQISGIGPAELLEELDVPVRVDLPGVGHNFQDHPMVGGFYNCESTLISYALDEGIWTNISDTKPGLFTTRNLTGDTLLQVQDEYFTNRTGKPYLPIPSCNKPN